MHIGKGIRTQPICSLVSAFKEILTKTYVRRRYDRVNVLIEKFMGWLVIMIEIEYARFLKAHCCSWLRSNLENNLFRDGIMSKILLLA